MNTSYRGLALLIGGLILAILVVAAVIVVQQLQPSPADAPTNQLVFEPASAASGISLINPPRPMPDFTLTNQDGDSLSLSELRGKPILISWGFTNCPDICPLTLSDYRRIHEELGEDGDGMHFVFISVDGARDTPEALASMFQRLDVDGLVIGLTGPNEDVMRIGSDYGVQAIFNPPNERGFYTVDHTGGSFLLDAEGRWIARYQFAASRSDIVADLRRVLAGG